MLNSKQRAKLRSLSSQIDATTTIGKDGLSQNVTSQIDRELTAHELVKVNVLENSTTSAKEFLSDCALILNAEEVCSIGRKFVLYRKSNKKGVKHIEL